MLWSRDFFPQQPALENRLLIHGHTPIPLTFILKQTGNCINIDGGCVYTNRPHFGNLVAIDLQQRENLLLRRIASKDLKQPGMNKRNTLL